MVNFAELKAKAEKAKDVSVTKVTNTRDRFSSVPSSKANWDPNWKRAPPGSSPSASASTGGPPPPPSRPDVIVSDAPAPPAVPRASRPMAAETDSTAPLFIPRPPPTRAVSGYPPGRRVTPQDALEGDRIDWTALSGEDKEAFFGWLDEFFSRYLGVELGPRTRRGPSVSVSATQAVRHDPERVSVMRAPPSVNLATRPAV